MILKGKVSSVEGTKARITFIDKENDVSSPLEKASHIGLLEVGDNVVVAFFSENMADGLIIAKY
jgi:hypothetical protein